MFRLESDKVDVTFKAFPSFFQFNNSVIHSKALGDFIKMYKKASSLPNMVERRRRRRQQQTQMTFQGR